MTSATVPGRGGEEVVSVGDTDVAELGAQEFLLAGRDEGVAAADQDRHRDGTPASAAKPASHAALVMGRRGCSRRWLRTSSGQAATSGVPSHQSLSSSTVASSGNSSPGRLSRSGGSLPASAGAG